MAQACATGARVAPGYFPGSTRPGLHGRDFSHRQRVAQGSARADPELGEHLLEVPLDGARAEEELGADLRVRASFARQAGDLLLLRCQLVPGVVAPLAHLLARRAKLVPGALGEPLGAQRQERVAGDAELLARIDAPALAAQPFPVEQARAGDLHAHARAREALDRFAVQALGAVPVARERA